MATWTNIPDGNLEPGDPIRSVDIIAIRDNPIAITEGASGAPKIQTAAITDANVTTAKLETAERMNTTNVLNATAGLTAGGVGTYAFLRHTTNADYAFGDTLAGSSLEPAGIGVDGWISYTTASGDAANTVGITQSSARSGTWRCLGVGSNFQPTAFSPIRTASVWLRIS